MSPRVGDDDVGVAARRVLRFADAGAQGREDHVAAEEPLQIRLNGEPVAVLMRTPGDDADLATGFAVTEQLVREAGAIRAVLHGRREDGSTDPNDIDVQAEPGGLEALERARRAILASSSCGLCGKTTLAAVHLVAEPFASPPDLASAWLRTLPGALLSEQRHFHRTGGLHAAGIFLKGGESPVLLREDIGRHNACDKVVGASLGPPGRGTRGVEAGTAGEFDLRDAVLLVSGRASFEVVQKAWVAGIGAVAALSAPSSLAVDLAREARMTLVGFLSPTRLNLYSGRVDGQRA